LKNFHPFKTSFVLRVRGKDDDGRRKIVSEEIQFIPVEYRMQASDVKEAVRKLILDQVNIQTHTDLALLCIELTLSRLGIHEPLSFASPMNHVISPYKSLGDLVKFNWYYELNLGLV